MLVFYVLAGSMNLEGLYYILNFPLILGIG